MEHGKLTRATLDAAFDDIITGKGVHRSKHELSIEGKDVTFHFLSALKRHGYFPATVSDIEVRPGERVPAFFIKESTAYFGWIFWEQFTQWKLRKLWGSVVRNTKGDWDIQLPLNNPATLYANSDLKLEMDIEHPNQL